jgi:hypothetical protein
MRKPPLFVFAHSPRILGPFLSEYRCGWLDGGCFVFARALQLWLGGCLAVIIRKDLYQQDTFDHCLLSVGKSARWYVDANGVSEKAALLQYWRMQERLPDPVLEDPVNPLRLGSQLKQEAWSISLAQQLQNEFGNPNRADLFAELGRAPRPRFGAVT